MSKTLDEVEELIRSHPGKENAITSREISEILGGIDTLDSTPQTCELIRTLVRERKVPIAACSVGYFLIQNQDELNEYLVNLQQRESQIRERRLALLDAVEGEESFPVQQQIASFVTA